jgi:glutamate 5-kinase
MLNTKIRQQIVASTGKMVVKVGTNAITDAAGRLDHGMVHGFAGQLAAVMKSGVSVTLVASGAVGAGMAELDLQSRPRELPLLQAIAAIGQGQLMRTFHDVFAPLGIKVAQVLLTRDDFEHRSRYLSIRNTLLALGKLGVLPIINENDAVGGRAVCFGDNDMIAALLSNMLRSDLLVLLSNVDGVLKDGQVVELIEQVDQATLSLASSRRSSLGSGGMGSKMSAAGMVAGAGEVAIIANARTPNILMRLLGGENLGTAFAPARRRMSSRRRWIGQAAKPVGKILIDDGAVKALTQLGKSLLPSGIRAVSGNFKRGSTVAIIDAAGRQIARGLSNYSADQIDKIKGLKTSQIAKALGTKAGSNADEVIHRNNMSMG